MNSGKILTLNLVVAAFLLLLGASGCNTIETPPPSPHPKDPRTFTWTIDTLEYPGAFQTLMFDVWASSPTDVYVVGHTDVVRGLMWHFDGTNWSDVKLSTSQGGPIGGPISLRAIHGFGPSDIYAVGRRIFTTPPPQPPVLSDSSLLIHYNGVAWNEIYLPGGRILNEVWGNSTSDMWVCGGDGTLFRSDGTWKRDSVGVYTPPDSYFQLSGIASLGSTEYMIGNTYENNTGKITNYFFVHDDDTWVLSDSFVVSGSATEDKWGSSGLWLSPESILYSVGRGVFVYESGSWTPLFFSQPHLWSVNGTGGESIFAVGELGDILHFNGEDWFQFTDLDFAGVVYTGVWTDGVEAFIAGWTTESPQRTVVLHGK